jgi:RNA polymerase sigma-70 factor, ECF subfamily
MTPSRDDAAVFTRIFNRHRHAVHAYFLGRVADPELARDLLQETFLRAWRRLSEIGPLPDEQQRAWIFTVARNLAIDSYRASAARRAAEATMRHHAAIQRTTVAGPHLHAELRERLALLDAAIRSLPEDLRVTLAMATARGADQPPDRRGPRRAGRHRPLPAQPGTQTARRRARPGG